MSNLPPREDPWRKVAHLVTFLLLRYNMIISVSAVADHQRPYLEMWQGNTDWMVSTNGTKKRNSCTDVRELITKEQLNQRRRPWIVCWCPNNPSWGEIQWPRGVGQNLRQIFVKPSTSIYASNSGDNKRK